MLHPAQRARARLSWIPKAKFQIHWSMSDTSCMGVAFSVWGPMACPQSPPNGRRSRPSDSLVHPPARAWGRWRLGGHRGRAAVRQHRTELPARADAKLSEHLAQVPLDGSRAEEQLGADLRVREALRRQPCDLSLLRGQLVPRLDAALAHCLAGGQQLVAGALGEALHPHLREHLVRDAAPFARLA